MSLKDIAQHTLSILDSRGYTTESGVRASFGAELDAAVAGSLLYTPEHLDTLLATVSTGSTPPAITVTDETTQVAAHRLTSQENIDDLVLLNFASARNPGGGFINGAKAQEEDLTRCSGLYPCLLSQPAYYKANRRQHSLLYTDHIIYSPRVPWFRTHSFNLLETPFTASVITAPAPNAGEVLRHNNKAWPEIEKRLRRRAGMVLAVARERGHRNLLLGAWGCGVFRNEPSMVADAFGRWLGSDTFTGAFDSVVFAVYDTTKTRSTLEAFRTRFGAAPTQ